MRFFSFPRRHPAKMGDQHMKHDKNVKTPGEKPPRKPPRNTTLVQAVIELLKVKTLVTLAIVGVMSHLAITEKMATETFAAVATAVVTYYFTRSNKDNPSGE